MFEFSLYNYLKTNYATMGGVSVNWAYGEAPDTDNSPYIVQYILDSNRERQKLCEDFADSGESFIQWNIYSKRVDVSDKLSLELEKVLDSLNNSNTGLTNGSDTYKIDFRVHNASPSAQEVNNELAESILTNTFTYRKV